MERDDEMNLEEVTLDDCIDNYEKKGKAAILEDGRLKGFFDEQEES